VQRLGITAIVTDDPGSYKIVAKKLSPGYQVCQIHVYRWLGKTLNALCKQLPGRRSNRNQVRSALEQLRDLLLCLRQDWQRYCTFQSEPKVPWTNNATERAIGCMKMLAGTIPALRSPLRLRDSFERCFASLRSRLARRMGRMEGMEISIQGNK